MAVEASVPTRAERAQLGDVPAAAPTGTKGQRTGPRWLLPALLAAGTVALLICLVVGGTVGAAAVIGLPDAGAGTKWALPIASFVAETAAVLGFGAALLAGVLIPTQSSHNGGHASKIRALSTAGTLSWLAAGATLVVYVLTLSDLTARPLPQALDLGEAVQLATFGPGRLLLISTGLSILGGFLAIRTGRRLHCAVGRSTGLAPVVVVLAAALVPWALGGHATQSGQDIASSSMIVHVLAAGAWVGGLAVVVMHVRGDLLITVLPRFSTLALWCWVAIGTSGVISGWLRLTTITDLWTSPYGRLLLVKLVLLGVLGGFGAWHRRRLAGGLRKHSVGELQALLRVAAVEVLVMGATMGVATALSGTAPTAAHAVGHDLVHGTSRIEGMVGHKLPVISTEHLLLLWRPDVIALLLTAVLLAGYLIGVRRLAAAGINWPRGRTCWALFAAVATVLVLNSGIASYANAVWSVTVMQQAVTSMVIPLAIMLSRPWDLIRPVAPRRRDGRAALAAHPRWVFVGYVGWNAAVLLTPLALWSVTNHAVLMFTRLGDIAVGTALFTVLLPSARVPVTQPTPYRRTGSFSRLLSWFAAEVALTGLLLSGCGAFARPWFTELNIAWITVPQDEQTAALVRLGTTVTVLVTASLADRFAAQSPLPENPNAVARSSALT